jgi:hypothetical protein
MGTIAFVVRSVLLNNQLGIGGQRQNRTADPLFFRQVLYRLSYLAVWRGRRDSNPRPPA